MQNIQKIQCGKKTCQHVRYEFVKVMYALLATPVQQVAEVRYLACNKDGDFHRARGFV